MNNADPTPTILAAAADSEERAETNEWKEALASLIDASGPTRARALLSELHEMTREISLDWEPALNTPYVNSIAVEQQAAFPGDLAIEERIASLMRWNALAMVARANAAHGELGGHIASYASAADLFEVGFNHFFKGPDSDGGADLVFYQPHSAPGVYARAFLEGRLTEQDLNHFRQEVSAKHNGARGLSSYPHPWLMPDFWQFPTGSMGIGPISSIYQARFLRYLNDRELSDTAQRRVWGVFGDGEMDEPESMSALTLAARERLDNLVWVVNCNLQRLDGPVRGNGRIIDELESLFTGAGWRVIKLAWGSDWDGLLARDTDNALANAFSQTVDGQFQTFAAKDGQYNRTHFFGSDPRLAKLVEGLSDDQIDHLKRGGHDLVKIYAAYAAAAQQDGRPTVILAQTKKGYGMGASGQGRMTTHQQKKLDAQDLIAFRDRFSLPLTDEQASSMAFYRPPADSPEMQYLQQRRTELGGSLPVRNVTEHALVVPPIDKYAKFATASNDKAMSTTMAFVRLLTNLLKDKSLGERIVPIVADEARTFGMAGLFRQIGIYSSVGQHYEPEDIDSVLSYREAKTGQILEEGISEAGAISSWIAAATSYAVNDLPMIPFYIYYSMFGFQRVADLIWAAADQRARGFLLGATSGRTTLSGEGLQHQDGSSLLTASTFPNCKVYDPATAAEVAVLIDHGMREMFEEHADVFYYLTVSNANFAQPTLPEGVSDDLIKGLYLHASFDVSTDKSGPRPKIRLLGSGAILTEVLAAANELASQWGIASEVWSATSYSELAREAAQCQREQRFDADSKQAPSHVARCLSGDIPIVATSDYVRAWPQLIAEYVDAPFTTLGTDGFGRSEKLNTLRRFFEVDSAHVVLASVRSLINSGAVPSNLLVDVIKHYDIETDSLPPWQQ